MGMQPVEEVPIPLRSARQIACWPSDGVPKTWVAGDALTAQEADALMQIRVAYENHINQRKGKDNGKD